MDREFSTGELGFSVMCLSERFSNPFCKNLDYNLVNWETSLTENLVFVQELNLPFVIVQTVLLFSKVVKECNVIFGYLQFIKSFSHTRIKFFYFRLWFFIQVPNTTIKIDSDLLFAFVFWSCQDNFLYYLFVVCFLIILFGIIIVYIIRPLICTSVHLTLLCSSRLFQSLSGEESKDFGTFRVVE